MGALADTNVLVCRFDPRFPEKQARATALLRQGAVDGSLRLAHQVLVEFVAATTRPSKDAPPLLDLADAAREVETFMAVHPVLYPDPALVRLALRGAAVYQLAWFDSHVWAYAELNGLDTLYSEDFQHGRTYGTVRAIDPFRWRADLTPP